MKTIVKILLVDDDPAILLATRRVLADDRFTIETAQNGEQALEKAHAVHPDLILLDVNLPDISGPEVCRRIKNDPELNESFVVLISAISTDSESQAEGLEEGADGYITRPIGNRELIARVDAMLRLKTTEDALRAREAETRDLLIQAEQAQKALLSILEDRQQAENDLRESEARYRELFMSNPHPMWVYNLENLRFLAVNDAAVIHYGYARDEFLGMTIKEIRPPEDVPALMENVAQATDGSNETRVWRHIKKNGELIQVEVSSHTLIFDGSRAKIILAHDVTEEIQIAQALKESEQRFRATFEQAAVGIAHVAPDGRWLRVNQKLSDITGYSREELLKMAFQTITHPNDLDRDLMYVQKMLSGELKTYALEKRYFHKDGSTVWINLTVSLVRDEQGNPQYFLSVIEDISRRKQIEEALSESETRYRTLLDQLPAIVYLDDLQDSSPRTVFVSPRIQDVLGYSPREWLAGGYETWIQHIHADDRERVIAHYQDSVQNGRVFLQEYRMTTRGGCTIWVRDSAAIQKDENGKPISMQGIIQNITETRQAESALRLQGAALEATANAILIADTQGVIQWVNPAYSRLTGYSAEEATGNTPHTLYSDVQDDASHKDLRETILSGKVWHGELVNKRKDGSLFHEEQTITPLTDTTGQITHFIGVKQDITSRRQAQEKIDQHIERLDALREIDQAIMSSFDVRISLEFLLSRAVKLLSVDAACVLLVNPAMNSLEFETGVGFITNTPFTANIRVGDSFAGKAAQEQRIVQVPDLANEPNNYLLTGLLKDEHFVSYYGIPLIVKGKTLGVLEIFNRSVVRRDQDWHQFLVALAGQSAIAVESARLFTSQQQELVERKKVEEELRKSHLELEKRIEARTVDLRHVNFELQRALRVKDEFLANMSHELRTPLNAIIGLSDSLAEQTAGSLNDKQGKYINTIRESGQHLLELINDILDLAKIESGQSTLSREKVDVEMVCQSSLRMIKQLALKKNLEVLFEKDVNLGMIWADERLLKQMLVNLLSNAVKFTPQNGRIGMRVTSDRENNTLTFTVWDTGIGIHEKDLPRLFQPFVQLDANLDRRSGGSGLGLALVSKMAAMHGGSISVESTPEQGSHFSIKLPCETAQTTGSLDGRVIGNDQEIMPDAKFKDCTILLVEDTEDVIMLVRDYLEHQGFKVAVALDGKDGIAQAEAIHPNLILMDIQMPVMDGLEATRRLRTIPALRTTPIIALTALAMKGDRERCIAAGMTDYISKPLSLKTLAGLIKNHLNGGGKGDA